MHWPWLSTKPATGPEEDPVPPLPPTPDAGQPSASAPIHLHPWVSRLTLRTFLSTWWLHIAFEKLPHKAQIYRDPPKIIFSSIIDYGWDRMPNALTRLRQEDLDINIKQLSNILWIMCSAFLSFWETLYVKKYIYKSFFQIHPFL